MKIAWCLLCRDRTEELMLSVRTHAPFVDKSIIVLHGANKANEDFLASEECQNWNLDVVLTRMPYDPKALRDLYMERLDVYSSQNADSRLWFLITDSDEYLELPGLYMLRQIASQAEAEGCNVVGFNAHDIQTAPDGSVWENKSSYWNPNFNKYYPEMRYTHGTHIGLARPAPVKMAQVPYRYFHVKSVGSQWLRGCRNYWTTAEVAQNNTTDALWLDFKALCRKHELIQFEDMFRLLYSGQVPEALCQWFILHRNHDNSEVRSWFVVYFVFLHPDLNIGCVGNRDFPYQKDRKPVQDLTF